MGTDEAGDQDPTEADRLGRAAQGDPAAWSELLDRYGARLKRMVALRLDVRLRGRIDPSDVIQEATIQAARGLPAYLERPDLPFFLWLRWLTGMTLQGIHRRHLGAQARDAGREVRIADGAMPAASSVALAAQLLGRDTRPLEAAIRAERRRKVQNALDALEPAEREVLALRHFEEFTNVETARVLNISEAAASKRYLRALRKIKSVLVRDPDAIGEPGP
jgi:RNA polymerase sigma-70 factor (ECF subfamily)